MNFAHKRKEILRMDDVCEITGLSKGTVYNKGNKESKYFDPSFPPRFRISLRAVGWSAELIEAWVQAKMDECNAVMH